MCARCAALPPVQIRRQHIGLPRCGRHVRRLRRNHPLKRAATGFPVFPVEQGIFSILSDKCRYGAENGRPNQAVARQFPLRLKREFAPVQSGIEPVEPGIRTKRPHASINNQKEAHRSTLSKSDGISLNLRTNPTAELCRFCGTAIAVITTPEGWRRRNRDTGGTLSVSLRGAVKVAIPGIIYLTMKHGYDIKIGRPISCLSTICGL